MASQPTVPKMRTAATMNFVGLVFFTLLVYQRRRVGGFGSPGGFAYGPKPA